MVVMGDAVLSIDDAVPALLEPDPELDVLAMALWKFSSSNPPTSSSAAVGRLMLQVQK